MSTDALVRSAIKRVNLPDGRVFLVAHDDNSDDPRNWDNLGCMVCLHRRYRLGDKHDYKYSDFGGWDELRARIESDNDVAVILPLYLYDHSGLTMQTTPFSCRWDSGQIGWIFCTREQVDKEFGGDNEQARACLRVEVETYDQFLTGDVYAAFILTPPCAHCGANGQVEDSCGGFFGADFVNNGILDFVPNEFRDFVKERL